MISQQVASTSFEEESPWKVEFKKAIDKPFRPWYPDGAVQDASYSLDTNNPFNGKISEKIELRDTAERPKSEAMNTRDAPHRVAVASEPVSAFGRDIELTAKPFSITLLELKLDRQ
jgi:hypothetical protein